MSRPPSDAIMLVLRMGFQHRIHEPNAEAGVARIQALAEPHATSLALHEALAACLRENLIHEPVRLPEGALQCHWRLELTPKGVAAMRASSISTGDA